MKIVNNFVWEKNDDYFSWDYDGIPKEMQFKSVPRSVVELIDKSGFAIVGSFNEFGKNNAFILNANGTERFKLTIPLKIKSAICFHEIYYIAGELTAIIATQNVDFACIINIDTGEYKQIYETR